MWPLARTANAWPALTDGRSRYGMRRLVSSSSLSNTKAMLTVWLSARTANAWPVLVTTFCNLRGNQGLGCADWSGTPLLQGRAQHRGLRLRTASVSPAIPLLGTETVKVWDAQTGQELLAFKGHADWVQNVGFSPDGKRLATASADKTVKVWDAETGLELLALKGHSGNDNGAAFSPDGAPAGERRSGRHGEDLGRHAAAGGSRRRKTKPRREKSGKGLSPAYERRLIWDETTLSPVGPRGDPSDGARVPTVAAGPSAPAAHGDERRHAHPLGHRARRPSGGRAAPAAGLRRAAPAGRPAAGREKPGQTLQATALVHEAYLRLVEVDEAERWDSRGHFFAAAAEAMRRILVENARRKRGAEARQGPAARRPRSRPSWHRSSDPTTCWPSMRPWSSSRAEDPGKADLVKLRFFAGLSHEEAAERPRHLAAGRPNAIGPTRAPGSTRDRRRPDARRGPDFPAVSRLLRSGPIFALDSRSRRRSEELTHDMPLQDEIFLRGVGTAGPGRARRYLEQACGSDTGLRGRVEELLAGPSRRPAASSEPTPRRSPR